MSTENSKKPNMKNKTVKVPPEVEKPMRALSLDELLIALRTKIATENTGVMSMADRFDGIVLRNITVRDLIIAVLTVADLDTQVQRIPTDQYDPGVSTIITKNDDGSVKIDIADMIDVDLEEDYDFCEDCDDDCGECCGCCGCDDEDDSDDVDTSSCMFGMTDMNEVANYFESVFGRPLTCVHSDTCEKLDCRYNSRNPNRK